jgi:hypothetical protein
MHHYHATYRKLPPNKLAEGKATWAVLILPFVEQDNIIRRWNLDKSYFEQPAVARQGVVSIYFCPSRRTASTGPTISLSGDAPRSGPFKGVEFPGALADYAVCLDPSGHDAAEET